MPRSRRATQAAAQESITPPDDLTATQSVARVVKAEGNSLYACELPNKKTVLLELEPKFRNTVFIKRGGFVLIDTASEEDRKESSRVVGEIINIVRDERSWRKMAYWPKEFVKITYEDSGSEEDNTGKMPPSDSEGEYEE